MMSRLLFAVVFGVSGSPDHTNLMQATKFAVHEKVNVDSAGEVNNEFDAEAKEFPEGCDECVAACERFREIMGQIKSVGRCRKDCARKKKCLTACIPPMEADRPEPLDEADQTSRGVVDGTGKLVVCGGSCNNARGVFDKMLELARKDGGIAKMAWIPSNWDMSGQGGPLWDNTEPWKQTWPEALYTDFEKFKNLSGWFGDGREGDKLNASAGEDLIIVHTTSKDEANSDEFANKLANRTGAWMRGGRQWRGMDVWGGTKAEQALHDMLSRGGVFGGTSAGASIQGDFLVRGQSMGANNNYVVVGDYQVGFGFVHKVAIDQHNTQRRRNGALLDWIEMNQDYLGIAIDENTFIVVEGDELEVFGENMVEIVDATLWQEDNFCSNQGLIEGPGRPLLPHHEKFFMMKPKSLGAEFGEKYKEGERYNIRTREVTFANSR